jgi:hypothetical protein
LYLENVTHPFKEDRSMPLKATSPTNRRVKKFGNLFIGAIVGGALVLRSAGSSGGGGSVTYTFSEHAFIPIEWAEDGAAPPDAAEVITSGNGSVRVSKFGGGFGSIVHDVVIPWEVPEDIVTTDGIKFTVVGVITQATGITTENVSFKLSGYSVRNGNSINGTFGSEVEVNLPSAAYPQYDRFKSEQSTEVTVTNLDAGETAFLHFERDTADASDTYAQPIGVYGVVLEWTRSATSP